MRIFHLVTVDEWAAALESGVREPASLTAEGFIHFSFADQVAGSAARHFGGASELLALEVHVESTDPALRVEDTYRTGTAYPHLYARLAVADIVAAYRLRRKADGEWVFNPDGEAAPASPDR